jgi:hypothetical protein
MWTSTLQSIESSYEFVKTVRKSPDENCFFFQKMTRGKLSSAWPKTELLLGKAKDVATGFDPVANGIDCRNQMPGH